MRAAILVSLLVSFSCRVPGEAPARHGGPSVGVLLLDGVYNSELMAPYDVFHHTVFHTERGMRVFTVGRSKAPVRSFEGLRIEPDHDFDTAPEIDVLLVPSSEQNMTSDLDDTRLLSWLSERGQKARWVMSVCDGAFLLAKAGLL
ncbi:MAG: DJ-1/PfpI family protein, partial [Planctomycetota bacterium]